MNEAKTYTAQYEKQGGYDSMYDAIRIYDGEEIVAAVELDDYGQEAWQNPTDETVDAAWETANLIAAAPELLAALEAALPHIECLSVAQSNLITMCGELIEKAKGE